MTPWKSCVTLPDKSVAAKYLRNTEKIPTLFFFSIPDTIITFTVYTQLLTVYTY